MEIRIENEVEFKKTNMVLTEVIKYSEREVNYHESESFKADFILLSTLQEAQKYLKKIKFMNKKDSKICRLK